MPTEVLTNEEISIRNFERYGIHNVKITELFEYGVSKFEQMMDDNCAHINNREVKESLTYL